MSYAPNEHNISGRSVQAVEYSLKRLLKSRTHVACIKRNRCPCFRAGYEFVMGSRFKGYSEPGAMPGLHRYFGTLLTTLILNVSTVDRIIVSQLPFPDVIGNGIE